MSFSTNQEELESSVSLESPQPCRELTFSDIQLATQNFDESLVIGRGGFGKVYKGTIPNGNSHLVVAVKRLDSTSNQGAPEFWAEVKMLSNLRHCHLVSLIGYCNDGQEMILVYEYMSYGTLEDHLHKSQTFLPWVRRLTICIGAARGLDYLHTGTGIKHGVVHRDVKSSNILLHKSWEAKISDFGLSKICPKNQQSTYVKTMVKGTFGYLDPDYFYTGKLTRKSDVYAFGVVLFEALCGKRAVDGSLDGEQWGLAIWAQDSIKEGRLKQIVDNHIKGEISPKCLKMFAQLAKRCLHKNLRQRPTMAEIVVGLESFLAMQGKAKNIPGGITIYGRKAPVVLFPSNSKNSVSGNNLNSMELYFETIGHENQTLHQFDYETLSIATGNFSDHNKISQLTSDLLCKGKLQNGQDIVIAGPSLGSRYKARYMNEASILVKLEHENLAKLLGYCIEGTSLLLVYDFQLYTSLDSLLFDPVCNLLNMDKRYKILLGVAKALLYLHKDAPIRVIHCDVWSGNILLNKSLDPRLSNFGIARCLASNESDCYMPMTRGTWGYTAPECMSGYISTGADVYSFGVLCLETITGRRANMQPLETNQSLVEYVYTNSVRGTHLSVIDPKMDVDLSLMKRLVEIGLLCTQYHPNDRPTMRNVVDMLHTGTSSFLAKMMRAYNIQAPKSPETFEMLMDQTGGIRLQMYNQFDENTCLDSTIFPNEDYDAGVVIDFISELCPR